MKHRSKGFTFLELLIVISIIAVVSSLAVAKFKTYEAKRACKDAAFILVSDLKLQQQNALTKEKLYGVTLEPGGYYLWTRDINATAEKKLIGKVDFKQRFGLDIRIKKGQEGYYYTFFPWTPSADNEWSVVECRLNEEESDKPALYPVSDIVVQGGGIECIISYKAGKFSLLEGN